MVEGRSKIIKKPFKNKVCKAKRQGPGKGILPRSLSKTRGKMPAPGKVPGAARYLPRQGAYRGKVRCRTIVLSLQCLRQRSILGPSRHAWQCTVPSGADGTPAFPISKASRCAYLDS